MNCLELRRKQRAEPRSLSDAAQAHLRTCASCQAFVRAADESERELERALDVPIPDGLADRVMLRARGGQRAAWHRWALAASVALAVAVALSFAWKSRSSSDAYARLAIEHVLHEPESLTSELDATPEALRAAIRGFGGRMSESLGRVRYVRLCPVEDTTGWHIVFETPQGLATLILVPGKSLAHAESVSIDGWNALAQPTRHGYYVVVTPSRELTMQIERIVRARIDWDV